MTEAGFQRFLPTENEPTRSRGVTHPSLLPASGLPAPAVSDLHDGLCPWWDLLMGSSYPRVCG